MQAAEPGIVPGNRHDLYAAGDVLDPERSAQIDVLFAELLDRGPYIVNPELQQLCQFPDRNRLSSAEQHGLEGPGKLVFTQGCKLLFFLHGNSRLLTTCIGLRSGLLFDLLRRVFSLSSFDFFHHLFLIRTGWKRSSKPENNFFSRNRFILPAPPFQFFSFWIPRLCKINGTAKDVENTAVDFNTAQIDQIPVENFRAALRQVVESADPQVDQVSCNTRSNSRNLLKFFLHLKSRFDSRRVHSSVGHSMRAPVRKR